MCNEDTTGFTFEVFASGPKEFAVPDLEVARNGSAYDKSELARHEDLDREVFLILAENTDININYSLAWNHTTPADILDRIAASQPELRPYASTNPHASEELKKTAPLAEHGSSSIEAFLKQVHATDAEARALVKRYNKLVPPGGPFFGDVWAEIRPE